jgi:hypothetical protein
MDENQVRQIVLSILNSSQYGVYKIPFHTHDGINSPEVTGQAVATGLAIEVQVVADTNSVDTSSGVAYVRVPVQLNGKYIGYGNADVTTAGTTNPTTIQVRNMTKYSSNDVFTSPISIASGATLGTAQTLSSVGLYNGVSTDDLLKIYVTANSTTKALGLRVWLSFY